MDAGYSASDAAAMLPLHALPVGARSVIAQLHQPASADDQEVLLRLI